MNEYLKETKLLNFSHDSITELFLKNDWDNLDTENKIKSIYNFVKDEIKFGYNIKDNMSSSDILNDYYGQCNTKGILLMSLLRKAGIPCRFHGFTIDKILQKGAITGLGYILSPKSIVHSWVEIKFMNKWFNLEGFIIDNEYLNKVQKQNNNVQTFSGYGIATNNLMNPQVYWDKNDTYIQKEGINSDLGTYDSPDNFFDDHRQDMGLLKKIMFRFIVRHTMNRNVYRIRNT